MDFDRVMTRLNPLIVGLLRSPLHRIASSGLLVLTVTGRRTGRRYSIPLGYQPLSKDRLVILVSKARRKQWWRNYIDEADTEVVLRGRLRRGRAVVVAAGTDAFRDHAAITLARLPMLAGQFGIAGSVKDGLSEEQLQTLEREIAVVAVALAPQ